MLAFVNTAVKRNNDFNEGNSRYFLASLFSFFLSFLLSFGKKGEKPETSFSPFPGLPLLFKYFFPQIYGWLILMIVLTSGLSDVVTNEVMFYIER